MTSTMWEDLENRRIEADRHRENTARLAQAYATFETTGQGSVEFETRVDFDITFIDKPAVSYGSEIDVDALGELQDLEPGETPILPVTSGYVTEWDLDDQDFYVGCWCAVRVAFLVNDAVESDLEVVVQHHFSFSQTAVKDVPLDLSD